MTLEKCFGYTPKHPIVFDRHTGLLKNLKMPVSNNFYRVKTTNNNGLFFIGNLCVGRDVLQA